MTENDIIEHLSMFIDSRKYPFQLHRSFMEQWEADYWAMDQKGVTREYEIKISRSDYRKDVLKDKHKWMGEKGPNYFYYVCPTDLIKIEEVDNRYGLIYVSEHGYCKIVKRPLKLHPRLFDNWKHLAVKMYWKWWKLWKEKRYANLITRAEYLNQLKNNG